jgi:CDP-glycerol glycerophosphotransferase (TagB/SpsB family)
MVAHGSRRWQLLLMSAELLASSHIDNYVVRPLNVKVFGQPRWKFVFLQHGVIQSDLSRWLNAKHVDLFVTSSVAEHESLVADHTPYRFTRKEVKLLGLPRHDGLRAKRAATIPADRDLLLVMPTWRKNLPGASVGLASNRAVMGGFAETEYAQQYLALLKSDRLRAVAAEHGLSIAFMPHPNLAAYLEEFAVPADIQVFTYHQHDVQQVLARATVMITDYSSVAFDAAAIEVAVIYFQFDHEQFHSGGHISRTGYFDYERDGFGPVCLTVSEVEAAAVQLLGDESATTYVERSRHTFAHHDNMNSERVIQTMLSLTNPTV